MFLESVNVVTGEREWVVAEEDYDLAQELARSRFADMILDYDRNDKFEAGLKTLIAEKKAAEEFVHVLDIGAGTGLLSLMAARAGADKVTSLEVFQPMARCAKEIVGNSEWKEKITVMSSRSTDLNELDGDRPNIIVSEVFDTELIGEGALRTFKEALTNLVKPGCRVVPSLGTVYVLPVESEFLRKFQKAPSFFTEKAENPLETCPGTSAVFDVQLSALDFSQIKPLCSPIVTFKFDFEDGHSIVYDEEFIRNQTCTESGKIDALLMWWDLDMDRTGKNIISMAPNWEWLTREYQWRDHWMQAVYFLPKNTSVVSGDVLSLRCAHDEFSMWFSASEISKSQEKLERAYCDCLLHSMLSRQTLFHTNDFFCDGKFCEQVEAICKGKSVVTLGEGSFLAILAARSAKQVCCVDSNPHFRQILRKYANFYQLKNVEIVENTLRVGEKPDVVISEPFFLSAMNPWQHLRFLYEVDELRQRFGEFATEPHVGELWALCERFDYLHNIARPVGVVSGFDLSLFDDISHKARVATDAIVDEQPLWEYSGRVTGEKFKLMHFDVNKPIDNLKVEQIIEMNEGNGIAFWMEWKFGDMTLSTGLVDDVRIGAKPVWNVGYKQGVYFPTSKFGAESCINLQLLFKAKIGELEFHFTKELA